MNFFQRHIIWVLFAILAIGEVGYYFFLQSSHEIKKTDEAVSLESGNVAVNYLGDNPWEISAKVKAIPQPGVLEIVKAPDRYPDFYRTSMEAKVKAAALLLKETPYDFTAWANYAILLENFDAFTKAEEIWKYLIDVKPEESFYHSRLAGLYHFSLKEYSRAEQLYKKTLSLNNKQVDLYHSFHDLYKFLYGKDVRKGIAVLEEGIKYNPGNLELLALIAQDYKEIGDTKKAKAFYAEAIDAAAKSGNYGLVEVLKKDRDTIK